MYESFCSAHIINQRAGCTEQAETNRKCMDGLLSFGKITAVQAAGLVDAHAAFATGDTKLLAAFLGVFLHGLRIVIGAAGRAIVALVQAEEDVVLVVAAHDG